MMKRMLISLSITLFFGCGNAAELNDEPRGDAPNAAIGQTADFGGEVVDEDTVGDPANNGVEEPVNKDEDPANPAVPVEPGEGPRLSDIFEAVFVHNGCTAGYCHGGAVDELLLADLETVSNNMVEMPSEIETTCGTNTIITPGDPEMSVLWYRVRPIAMDRASSSGEPCVPKMPKGSDGLDAATAQLVYDWIAAGARR